MDGSSAHGSARAQPGSPAAYWLRLVTDHVVPGTLFALLAYAQAYSAYGVLRGEVAAELDTTARSLLIAQRLVATLFYLLAAYLFTIRAPRQGPRSGPIGAIIALAG